MTLKMVIGCNRGYFPRTLPYLATLKEYADFPVTFVGVAFAPPVEDYGIEGVGIKHEQNAGAPERIECIQHGSFLKVTKGKTTDVYLYTDTDFIMQRAMDDDERKLMKLKHNQVCVGYNGSPNETLAFEYGRLQPKVTIEKMQDIWGASIFDKPIYNLGAIAMTRKTWQAVYDRYMELYEQVNDCFTHTARQQWLVSYVIADLGLDVQIMPWSFHAHGHFGLKPGMERRTDGIYADGKKALFRHFI